MPAMLANTVCSTLEPSDNPYLGGAWRPTFNEWNAAFATGDAEVVGTIPTDIAGVYVRSGENQIHQPIGRYHPFDGDGLLHSVSFKNGRATYRSRFVRTEGFEAEAVLAGGLPTGEHDPVETAARAQEDVPDLVPADGALTHRVPQLGGLARGAVPRAALQAHRQHGAAGPVHGGGRGPGGDLQTVRRPQDFSGQGTERGRGHGGVPLVSRIVRPGPLLQCRHSRMA